VTPPVVALESFAEPWRRDYNSVVMSDLLAIVRNLNRLAAVQRSGLLDTPAEETFDRFTRLATRLFKTPVALVSIVDGERQFFKSAIGLPEPWQTRRETPLTHSFCKHAVALQEPLVIGDARKDPTYRDNPAVRDLKIIAYAGVPLMVSGNALGAFCVIDDQPHAWSYDEVRMLRDLAGCPAINGLSAARLSAPFRDAGH
jgi:GAF domain-containing protein